MTEKKKLQLMILLPILIFVICMISISGFWLREYRQIAYEHISKFCETIIENNPESESMVLSTLKEYVDFTEQEVNGNEFLTQYGYRSSMFGKGIQRDFILISVTLVFAVICAFSLSVWLQRRRNKIRINELTSYLEQINVGAAGTIIQTKEDEFSHLQDELYKTVTTLYQTRDAAVNAKADFADNLANIAHQLKTPITASFLSLQLMKEKSPNVYAEQIKKQLDRLNRLEESLLTLSRIDSGTLQLEHSKVDIFTALCLAAENLNDLLVKENISVSIPEKGCIEILGDLEWTMEALINLIKNCMEHSSNGGTIHCDYSQNPLYVEILIWDDGKGFDTKDIPHLFERFYRGQNATGNGIGIGLSLSRSIFELQNGNISARNLPEGGACFEIRVYSH